VRVVIPAAGLGRRFADQNLGFPKELLPLGGKPVLEHALNEANRAGFEAAIVVLSPAKYQIAQFLARTELPIPIETVIQSKPIGIGDAVLRCWKGEPLAVLLPDDVVLGTDHWARLLDLHRQSGAPVLCVRQVPLGTTDRFGIAEIDGNRVLTLVEKPAAGTSSSTLAIFGRYVVTESVVAGLGSTLNSGELELTIGLAKAINTPLGVRAVHFDDDIYDCGTPAAYASSVARFKC
jgi:UTP--glucose-1-phosphate uridylyltransferase